MRGATHANPAEIAANGINTVCECYTADIDPTQSNANACRSKRPDPH